MVRRTCLSFAPSGRDRADFTALGASVGVLREIDACARRTTATATASPRATRATLPGKALPKPSSPTAPLPAPRAPPTPSPAAPLPATLSPTHTVFVAGTSQHDIVGSKLALPLVFQALADHGTPVRGQGESFTARYARVDRAATGTGVGITGGSRAGTGDRHIRRVRGVRADSAAASVTLDPAGPGSTALQLQWLGVRLNFTVTVAPGAARRGC